MNAKWELKSHRELSMCTFHSGLHSSYFHVLLIHSKNRNLYQDSFKANIYDEKKSAHFALVIIYSLVIYYSVYYKYHNSTLSTEKYVDKYRSTYSNVIEKNKKN